MIFFDTNVLLYTEDRSSPAKADRARDLLRRSLREGSAVISAQVLSEFYVNAVKKFHFERSAARRLVQRFSAMRVVPLTSELIAGAVDLHQVEQISYWDALIVRAASTSGCQTLLSEDLGDGRRIDGLVIEDPFRGLDSKD